MTNEDPLTMSIHPDCKVCGGLSCQNGDVLYNYQKREMGDNIGLSRRIIGTVAHCHTCGGPILSTVFPLLYCGKCNSYSCSSEKMASIPLGNDEEKETNIPEEGEF